MPKPSAVAFPFQRAHKFRMKLRVLISAGAVLLTSLTGEAETVKDREGAVRGDRAKMQDNNRWIYNDVKQGFAVAKETGKPMMVVLRCVPCLACMGLDTEVLIENKDLKPLMDQFVRVRLINANSIDLQQFQFDYDLSFSTLFFNPDGTLYGRYGSWEHQHDAQNRATATLRQTLQGILKLHSDYPANKASLAGKQGRDFPYRHPIEMPTLKGKYLEDLNWSGKVVKSCVHCHQIGDAQRLAKRSKRETMPLNLIYPHPAPKTIGMTMAHNSETKVAGVTSGSPAATAGILGGDIIKFIDGQAIVSAADIAWGLHHAPDEGTLPAVISRNGMDKSLKIYLGAQWRMDADIFRRVGTWPMRAMAFGGMRLIDLTDDERKVRGLDTSSMALLAKNVGKYGKHGAARKAGFRVDDVIVEVNGDRSRKTESRLLGEILRAHQAGKRLSATVLRGKRRMSLKIPVQ